MADEKIRSVPSYIHGIGSSTAIDTAGEIVDLAGLDCSSLIGAPWTWEHQNSSPTDIVGKILDYKKIFSEEDCENEHHKYFWDKCKIPFLYVMGRLFDDKKDSSKEVAALFIDDAEHPEEHPSVGLSVEGSKISKSGIIVDKSIARKITITNCPANKTCVAELMPTEAEQQSSKEDSIFKSESTITIDLHKSEPAPKPMKHGWKHAGDGNFSHPKHGVVSVAKQPSGEFQVRHHGAVVGVGGKKGSFGTMQEAGAHAGEYMRGLSEGRIAAPQMHDRPSPQMGKAMTAGSGMASPQTLTGGAALQKEDQLNKPVFNTTKGKDLRSGLPGIKEGAGTSHMGSHVRMANAHPDKAAHHLERAKEIATKTLKNKSKWLARAEQEYNKWEKREQFEAFMAKRMPNMEKGEIKAIGQTLCLAKSLKKLKKDQFGYPDKPAGSMASPPPEPNKASAAAVSSGVNAGDVSLGQAASNIGHALGFGKSENPKKKEKTDLIHYSSHPNLTEVDPKHHGSGVDSRTKGRDTWHPHSFYYRAGTEPESVVKERAPHKYTASTEHSLYDIGHDKEGHIAGSGTMDEAHEKIKAAGHGGFFNSKHDTLPHVVAMYHPLKVKPANEGMAKAETQPKNPELGNHFLFSAENPMHAHKDQMKMTHEQTMNHLKQKGFNASTVQGHYGSPETSIMVHNVSPEQAEHLHGLASKMGQDSSIYSQGGKHEMRFHHGEQAGKKVLGEGTTFHTEKPKDMFTTLPSGQHFTHNFKF